MSVVTAPAPVINMTRGMPPVDVFPVDDLVAASTAALRNDASVLLQYGRSPGYKPLREWLGGQHGVPADYVLVGNSSLEIMDFIARTHLGPGQRVFVEQPSYDRAITTLRRTGAVVVGIPLLDDGVDIAAFEREIRNGPPALFYTIADFQNPMGVTTSAEKRRRLAGLAREHDFWIIEDAPYRKLRFWGAEAPMIYSLAPERVMHLSSFSKILAPGLRLGYIISTPAVISQLAAFAVDTYIGPVFPTQGVVYEYCRAGLLEPNIAKLNALYAPRLTATLAALEEHFKGATWTRPEGGFFVGVTLPQGASMAELLPRAEQAGIKLSDGRGFYPSPTDGDRFLRIPFCSITPEDIHRGIARLAAIL